MRSVALIAALFLLSCGGVSKATKEAADGAYNNAMQVCNAIPPTATFTEYVQCSNKVIYQYYENINYPYMDLIQFFQSYTLAVARRVDNNEITPAAAVQSIQEIVFQIKQAENQRDFQAYQKRMNWVQLFVTTFNNNYSPNYPITCIQNGNFFTCN